MSTLAPDELRQLEERLRARHAQLIGEVRDMRERVAEPPFGDATLVLDSGDQSSASVGSDVDHAQMQRDLDECRAIDAALARIADDTYGSCIDCGQPIAPERLRASPEAMRCIACQAQRERTYAPDGGARP